MNIYYKCSYFYDVLPLLSPYCYSALVMRYMSIFYVTAALDILPVV